MVKCMTVLCVPFMFGDIVDKYEQLTIDTKNSQGGRMPKSNLPPCFYITERRTYTMKPINRKDIYYADLNQVRGSEQGGVRPVLILQNDMGNKHSPTTIIAPITSRQTKAKLPTHVDIQISELPKDSIVLLEQIRTIDKTRLGQFVGTLDKSSMGKVDHAIVISLGIKYLEELLT